LPINSPETISHNNVIAAASANENDAAGTTKHSKSAKVVKICFRTSNKLESLA